MSPTKSAAAPSTTPARKGARVGVVTSDRRDKTRTVMFERMTPHSKYGKYVRGQTHVQVHDAGNESREGDTVEVAPCRPISKSKTWSLVRIVERRPEA